MASKVCAKVPASTANLGPGFDALGMALDLHLWVEMAAADETVIHLHGDHLGGIPTDKRNLIYQVAQQVFAEAGVAQPELEISVYSDIPLTRGLGSSASAIVGALVAANALIGGPLSDDKLFQMASALEKHPDNVGAALFGGFVAAFWDGSRAEHIRIEPHADLECLVLIPEFQLSTEKARLALPQQVSMKDAVFNVGHSSLLVAALCTGNLGMIRHAMKDALHQPYRMELVPGMEEILAGACDHGALGAALSGAGPTVIAFVDRRHSDVDRLEAFMKHTFASRGIAATAMRLKPYPDGARLLTLPSGNSTFIEKLKGEVRA